MTQREPRIRRPKFLAWLRTRPCACCGAPAPSEAAHIRTGSKTHKKRNTGMAEKPHDHWALPLNAACHRRQHSMNELEFWGLAGKDPFQLAKVYFMGFEIEHGIQPEPNPRRSKPVKARKPRDRRTKIPQRKTAWPKRTMR